MPTYVPCFILQTWKQTLWSDIKTEEMEEGAKNFVKEVKALPKRVRLGWAARENDDWSWACDQQALRLSYRLFNPAVRVQS